MADIERLRELDLVKEQTQRLGIWCVGFDGDNTVWRTSEVYEQMIYDVACVFARNPDDVEIFVDFLNNEIDNLRDVLFVNPGIIHLPVAALAETLGIEIDDIRVKKAVGRTHRLFEEDKFELIEGADQVLQSFGEPVMFTHAEQSWTDRKIAESGIGGLLADVVCMDVDRSKKTQWEEVLAKRELEATNFLMVGDNLYEEILPILKLGGRAIWIDMKGELSKRLNELDADDKKIVYEAINAGRFACVWDIRNVPDAFLGMR